MSANWRLEARWAPRRCGQHLRTGGGTPPDPPGTWGGPRDDVGCRSRTGVDAASLCTSFGDEHGFRPTRHARRVALPTSSTSPQPDRLARSLPDTRDILDELTGREVELSPGGWLSPGSAR